MSFLTPLYIAGIAAVSLPILFHMIRRTPRGRIPFSTVMFLDPSPPRVTRRSRLDNWPLLLLRALALTLLAIAFARPFWRNTVGLNVAGEAGRQLAILIDTSASMRRGEIWTDAVNRVDAIVEKSAPVDQISLTAFDRRLTEIVSFEEWASLDPAARKKLIRQRLEETKPGWAATETGAALKTVAESLVADDAHQTDRQSTTAREIILISDMQVGSVTEPLGTFQWPAGIRLTIEQVVPSATTNAGLQLAANQSELQETDGEVRVRVVNAADSTKEQFQLRWHGEGPFFSADEPTVVYVPAGRSRIVRVPRDANLPATAKLVLSGDDHEFDNSVTVHRAAQQVFNVLYIGNDTAADSAGLRYYVERAFPTDGIRQVQVVTQSPDGPTLSNHARETALVIVAAPLPIEQLNSLRRHAEAGGSLLFVAATPEVCQSFGNLVGLSNLKVQEANVEGYAMLSDIDFEHPLFSSFNDPRFSDFTSIHFWKYRHIDGLNGCRVLARFDQGSPAIVTRQLEQGSATLLAAGWNPADSQLALSTKFVPLMNALLEMNGRRLDSHRQYDVGDAIPIAAMIGRRESPTVVHAPDQQQIQLTSGQRAFTQTVTPGIYRVGESTDSSRFSVVLAAGESRTAPMPLETLESLGVSLQKPETATTKAAAAQRERQLKAAELEGQQKFWMWLILTAIIALIAETWLAGRMTRSHATAHVDGETA